MLWQKILQAQRRLALHQLHPCLRLLPMPLHRCDRADLPTVASLTPTPLLPLVQLLLPLVHSLQLVQWRLAAELAPAAAQALRRRPGRLAWAAPALSESPSQPQLHCHRPHQLQLPAGARPAMQRVHVQAAPPMARRT